MYNHACTDPSCVFCRQSTNGNLNVEGIAMYYVQENTVATTMNVHSYYLQFSTKTLGQIFFHSWGHQGRTQDITILSIVYNPDHSILVADS